MPLAFPPRDRRYVAYIDEAGDPGLSKIRTSTERGSSEWLVLSAIVVRTETEPQVVEWVRDIRASIGSVQGPALHYRTLSDDKKAAVCSAIAGLPLRGFVLLSNKKNMQGYRNTRVEAARGASTQEYFYNFCLRLLLERVTHFVERHSLIAHSQPKHAELVFSERGGLRYSQTIEYLALLMEQARSQTTFLERREVRWRVLHPMLMSAIAHNRSAGSQLADPVASAFFQATNTSGDGKWNTRFAELLAPRMLSVRGKYENLGVSLQPTPYRRANLTDEQKRVFHFYGFKL